jgi:hypothetical protein
LGNNCIYFERALYVVDVTRRSVEQRNSREKINDRDEGKHEGKQLRERERERKRKREREREKEREKERERERERERGGGERGEMEKPVATALTKLRF